MDSSSTFPAAVMNYVRKAETAAANPNLVKKADASAESSRISLPNWKVDPVGDARIYSPLIPENQRCSYTYN